MRKQLIYLADEKAMNKKQIKERIFLKTMATGFRLSHDRKGSPTCSFAPWSPILILTLLVKNLILQGQSATLYFSAQST